MVLFGSVATLQVVWNMADLFMGLMVITNLIAITLLGRFAYAALTDYVRQKKQGKDPVFSADSIPGLTNTECWDKQVVTDKRKKQCSEKASIEVNSMLAFFVVVNDEKGER